MANGDASMGMTEESEASLLLLTPPEVPHAPRKGKNAKQRFSRLLQRLARRPELLIAASIVAGSLVLGLTTPVNDDLPAPADCVSNVLGWLFFLAWSLSFYPQVVQNYVRGDTIGLSPDYLYLNLAGYVFYSLYNSLFFFDERLRQKYRDSHQGNDILVEVHDLVFALHGLVLTAVQVGQCLYYNGRQQIPQPAFQALCGVLVAVPTIWFCASPDPSVFQVTWLSYQKLFVTVLKYLPQLIFNHRRRSTVGWSIGNILLDITGGVFSTLQLFLDAFAVGDPAGIGGQAAKLGLGLVSIAYDLAFIAQHYCLYKERRWVEAPSGDDPEDLP